MTHPYNHAARVRNRVMTEQRSIFRGRKAMGQVEIYRKPDYLVGPKYPKMGGVYSDERDDRQMLLRLGAGEIGATLSIPYLPQTPRISDPDAQGVIKIVESLQRGLNRLGCNLRTDGFLGPKSTHCLKQVAGRNWHDKSWLQLMGDVVGAIDAGLRVAPVRAQGSLQGLGADPEGLQYQTVNGVCVGTNGYTRDVFTSLQQQLNRVASVRGLPRIAVDGKIGSQTMAAVERVMDPSILEPSFFERLLGTKSGCEVIASQAEDLIPAIGMFADQLQAAPVRERRAAPKMTKEMIASTSPITSRAPLWLLGAVAAGGAYWYMTRKPKKKKR